MTEEFFKEHMFPETPDTVLTTLGSLSAVVSLVPHRHPSTRIYVAMELDVLTEAWLRQ